MGRLGWPFPHEIFQFLTHVVWRVGVLAAFTASLSALTSRFARFLCAFIKLLWTWHFFRCWASAVSFSADLWCCLHVLVAVNEYRSLLVVYWLRW